LGRQLCGGTQNQDPVRDCHGAIPVHIADAGGTQRLEVGRIPKDLDAIGDRQLPVSIGIAAHLSVGCVVSKPDHRLRRKHRRDEEPRSPHPPATPLKSCYRVSAGSFVEAQ
jgi:hypothetical protein